MSDGASNEWGRVAEDGTVYVRTTDGGEREVGSWQAGSPEEGLTFFTKRYDELAAEIDLLAQRAEAGDPKAVLTAVQGIRDVLPEAKVVGDLAALDAKLGAVVEQAEQRIAQQRQERREATDRAIESKRILVAEAQELAQSTDWKAAGDRYRTMVEEWKRIRGVDRKTDSELWEQLSAARREFDRRRKAHFAELEEQRKAAAARKEQLVMEAEKLADSTDWGPTARRFKDLMASWKAAGRAGRDVDDALWARFKAAQDTFFGRRSETFSVRDAEQQANLDQKLALLTEAESLDPDADPQGATRRLRQIQEKWEKVGHVPRDQMHDLERRLGAVEDRVRRAGAARRTVTTTESPLVVRLRESVAKLESRIERARAAGDTAAVAEHEAALATQREWLAQAERSRD